MLSVCDKKQWPNNSGIYEIYFENSENGKRYIGSTMKGFAKRWKAHLSGLHRGTHVSVKLQNAFNKYGESRIRFNVVESCEEVDLVLVKEQHYIDTYNSHKFGYNSRPVANSQLGYKHRTETLDKIKATNLKKLLEQSDTIIDLYSKGYTLKDVSEVVGLNYHTVSNILKYHSVDIKPKAFYYKIPIYQYDLMGRFIGRLESAYEASSLTGIEESNIRAVLKRESISAKGFFFSYEQKCDDEIFEEIQQLTLVKSEKSSENKRLAMTPERIARSIETRKRNSLLRPRPPMKLRGPSPKRVKNIHQYDLEGNLIKVWTDSAELVEFYGLKNFTPVLRVIKGERLKFKNCIWNVKN